jgi:glycosidase
MRSINDFDLNEITSNREFTKSPERWEGQILYFLIIDRFSNNNEGEIYNPDKDYENALKDEKTKSEWEEYGDKWNGGTLQGLTSKLDYLKEMGVTALWVSPIFKQVPFEESYHGYGIQNFLEIDPHLGTTEDLQNMVKEAHKRGIYVILDIILNHTGNVFRYEVENPQYTGEQYKIQAFHDKNGEPTIAPDNFDPGNLDPDDGVYPVELMNLDTFTRKGAITNWDNYPEYIEGDFFSLKNIHTGEGDENNFRPSNALKIITECYKYWIAAADIDGFRLDTVKHLHYGATRYFVTQIHEFAESIGKNNFYIMGEITGGMEYAIKSMEITGLNAALGINKIPEKLENTAKGYTNPEEFFDIFKNSELLGEDEYKWYRDNVITMFDDHDMVAQGNNKSRFCSDKKTAPLLLNAVFINLMTHGIPCIYYGTEQCFDGAGDSDKYVREAMFGGKFGAFRSQGKHFFDQDNRIYKETAKLADLRSEFIGLRQGRQYLREVSYDGKSFEIPHMISSDRHTGVVVWSRIFNQVEFVLAVNCDMENDREAAVVIDQSLHQIDDEFECIYSSAEEDQIGAIKVNELAGSKSLNIKVPKSGCVIFRQKNI